MEAIQLNIKSPEVPAAQVIETPSTVTPVVPEVVPEKKESLSSQFAALAKKEKRILSERQSLEAQNKELAEKLKQYEQFETKKKSAKTNPLEFLTEAGLTYDEITQFMLNGGEAPKKDKATELEEKLNEFMSKSEQEKKEAADKQAKDLQEQEEKIIAQFKDSVRKQISDQKDKYELINLRGEQEMVIAVIEAHYDEKKEILSTEAAADLVEKHLEDQVIEMTKASKFKDKFKMEEKKSVPSERRDSVTLNSSMPSSSVPSSLPTHTENDRLKRALAALGN